MASNPMQRKSRISFLLGMLLALLISGVIIALLFLQLKKVKDEQAAEQAQRVTVYTVNQDVKSGQVLTENMFSRQSVNRTTVPNNATSVASVIDTWFMQTREGDMVQRDQQGLYLNKADSIVELTSKEGSYYRMVDGVEEKVTVRNDPLSDTDGLYVIDNNGQDTTTRVYEETTGYYYIYKVTTNGSTSVREKVSLELVNVPVLAKVDMNQNTVITPKLVIQSDEVVTDDVRRQEYNMVVLPMDLMTDDYIDIRLMTPNGQDFIVISKKRVEIPVNADGTYVANAIRIDLREDEILSLSSAIVEAYGISGAKLYANKYKDPGLQNAAQPTYTPNTETTALIESNPNIVQIAMQELAARYSNSAKNLRNNYLQTSINDDPAYKSNVVTGIDESITNTQETRKQYLDSLGY